MDSKKARRFIGRADVLRSAPNSRARWFLLQGVRDWVGTGLTRMIARRFISRSIFAYRYVVDKMLSSTFLHELRDVPIMLALLREERFQISGNDAVERILFGIARPVDVFKSHRDVRACKHRCIRPLTRTMTYIARRTRIPADRD